MLDSKGHDAFVEEMIEKLNAMQMGDPLDPATQLGPVVSQGQMESILNYITIGKKEGAVVACGGGRGKGSDLDKGNFVQPTLFTGVNNQMCIAREEIFGPVLSIIAYEDDNDAINIANDTDYGLSGYVSGEISHAQKIARQIRTGMVHINGAGPDFAAPFGGYKQSGNGREWGLEGFEEFLETKAMMGAA